MKVWNFEENKEVFTMKCHNDYIRGLTCTNDGNYIITGGDDGYVKLWDVTEKKREICLDSHQNIVSCLDINKNVMVSGSDDKTVKFWDLCKNELMWTYTGHTDRIFSVCLKPDNSEAYSCSADCTVRVYNLSKNDVERIIKGHVRWIRKIVYSVAGLYTGGDDNLVYFTSFTNNEPAKLPQVHTKPVYSLSISPNYNFLASGSTDSTITLWSTSSNNKITVMTGHKNTVMALVFYSENVLISGSFDSSIKIWNIPEGLESFTLYGHSGYINDIAQLGNKFVSVSNDSSIRVWDMQNRCEDFSILNRGTKCVSVRTHENNIVVGSSNFLIELFSASECKSDEIVKSDYQSSFDFLAAFGAYENNIANQNSSQLSLTFGKHKFTLLHLFAHLGDEEKLKKCLEQKTNVRKDEFGNSPIYYALERNSQPCVDLLLLNLIEYAKEKEKYYQSSYSIRDDLVSLVSNSSTLLPTFFDTLNLFEFQRFGCPAGKLPLLKYSYNQRINSNDFLIKDDTKKDLLVVTKTSAIELPFVLGSNESTKLLRSLIDCNNKLIFKCEIVKNYINEKWSRMYFLLMLYTLLLWINLGLFLFAIAYEKTFLMFTLLLAINIVLAILEVIQLVNSGFYDYITDTWNASDLFRLALNFLWIILAYNNIGYLLLTWLVVIMNALKGLIGFRSFDKTRFYVRLIIRSFQDIFFFMIIFFYSTLCFGLLFLSSIEVHKKKPSYYLWLSSFDLNLGNFDTNEDLGLHYATFLLASIFNTIILLSLLISILGDSFDKFLVEAEQIDFIEMAEYIYEMELILFWNKGSGSKQFLQSCEAMVREFNWEGSIKEISDAMHKIVDSKFTELKNDIAEKDKRVMEVLGTLQEKIYSIDFKLKKIHSRHESEF